MQAYMTSLVLLAAVALPVAAQEPQCQNANPQAQAACNTMVDATKAFHPLAGPPAPSAGSAAYPPHCASTPSRRRCRIPTARRRTRCPRASTATFPLP